MNKKLLLLLIGATLLIVAIPLTLFVMNQQQDIRSNASTGAVSLNDLSNPTTPSPSPSSAPVTPSSSPSVSASPAATSNSCTAPTQVSNVKLDYPSCNGTSCNFSQASCSWAAVSGSTSYSIKITEVESSSVVKTETLSSGTTSYVFPVTPNKTYRCEVSAVNSCGTGPSGADQLLCQTDTTPSISPSPSPSAAPNPTTPPAAACGSPCTNGTTCAAGLTCVTAANSTKYCAVPAYQNACATGPSVTSCCTAPAAPTTPPVVQQQLPPTGVTTTTILLGIGGLVITVIGGALLFL